MGHKEVEEGVRKVFEMSRATNDDMYEKTFGKLTRAARKDNDLALLALGPIVSGLILESHFELEALSEKPLRRILGRIFDSLFPVIASSWAGILPVENSPTCPL